MSKTSTGRTDELTILGRTVRPKDYTERKLESFDIPESIKLVEFSSDELTANCEMTQQRDFYDAVIRIAPRGRTLEAKSLKLYAQSWQNENIFAERLAAKICEDIFDAIQPQYVEVVLKQHVRGGISITTTARILYESYYHVPG